MIANTNRRGFLGAAFALIGISIATKGSKHLASGKADFGRCACGSSSLWWADHSEAAARGALIQITRPDGEGMKIDVCADCGSMRTVRVKQVTMKFGEID